MRQRAEVLQNSFTKLLLARSLVGLEVVWMLFAENGSRGGVLRVGHTPAMESAGISAVGEHRVARSACEES